MFELNGGLEDCRWVLAEEVRFSGHFLPSAIELRGSFCIGVFGILRRKKSPNLHPERIQEKGVERDCRRTYRVLTHRDWKWVVPKDLWTLSGL